MSEFGPKCESFVDFYLGECHCQKSVYCGMSMPNLPWNGCTEKAQIIMDNYKEIELPQRQWKDGDILIDEWNTESYAVFKEYGKEIFFRAYFVLLGKEILFDELIDAEHYRLANAEEMRKAPMLFYFLFNNLDAVRRCLPKKG